MRFLLIPLVLLLLAGCAPGGVTADFAKAPKPDPAGILALYRDGNAPGSSTYVLIDGHLIGAVSYLQVLRIPLAPGAHQLTAGDATLAVSIAAQQIQNVLLSMNFWGIWHLFPLSDVQAETWAKGAIDASDKILSAADLPDLNAPKD